MINVAYYRCLYVSDMCVSLLLTTVSPAQWLNCSNMQIENNDLNGCKEPCTRFGLDTYGQIGRHLAIRLSNKNGEDATNCYCIATYFFGIQN